MIIAVDFDGPLNMGEFPNISIPPPYAIEVMKKLKADGHYLIINTCRCDERLIEAINFLLKVGCPFDRVNENEPNNIAKYNSNSRKIYAHCYIDDRNVGGMPTWPEIYEHVRELEEKYLAGKP